MRNITISTESMLAHADPCHKGGDLLLLLALLDRAEKVLFQKRGDLVVPVVKTQSRTDEMLGFPCCLAGRWMNYYKNACGIRHPMKECKFSAEINGEVAKFHFEIAPAGSAAFALLTRITSTVRRRDCKEILDQHEN